MLQQLIDNLRDGSANAVRLTSEAAVAALALMASLLFLCAAAFVLVMQRFGLIEACLAEAGIFFVVAMIAWAFYLAQKRQGEIRALARQREAEERAADATQSTLQSVLTDPVLLAAVLQMIRSVGTKRLVPILAVAGIAIGFLVANHRDTPPEGH